MSADLLRSIPLFRGLDTPELDDIFQLAKPKHYRKNTVIITQGDDTDSMYVIVEGRCRVVLNDDEGHEVVLNTIGDGDYFGDLALLDKPPRAASVITVEPTHVLIITQPDFSRLLDEKPQISRNLLTTLARRLRGLAESVGDLALLDVYGRVARFLIKQAEEQPDGELKTERLTQQEIASMVGSSREMVSRILKDLREGNYIDIQDKQIILKQRSLPKHW